LDENSGILPRLAFFIFQEIKRLHDICKLDIEVSAIEVYCDTIKELLITGDIVTLQTDSNKQTVLQGQKWKKITESQQMLQAILKSANKRIFGKNALNDRSSRSHHIFQVRFTRTDKL
jgi:hypothetical protein